MWNATEAKRTKTEEWNMFKSEYQDNIPHEITKWLENYFEIIDMRLIITQSEFNTYKQKNVT